MKQLAEEFKGKIECLVESTEKYITFSVPIYKKMIMIMIMILMKKNNNKKNTNIQTKTY